VKRRLLATAALALVGATQEDRQRLYEEGVAARHAGDNERAIELLRRLVSQEPGNADAQLQLGLALMAADRLAEAEAALRRTLELAPSYEDARIALARIEQRRGNLPAAQRHLDRVSPTNAEAAGLRSALDPSPAAGPQFRTQVNFDASYSALDGGAPDWREAALSIRHQATEATAVTGTLEPSRRFGLDDVYGEVRVDHRLSDGASVYVSAGATPDADFRPRWQVGAGGAVRVADGPQATVLTLDARQARYPTGDIQTITPGIEQYVGGGSIWFTGRIINIFDEGGEHHLGWLGRGDVQLSPRLRFFAGAADAPDTSAGVIIDTFSLFGGIAVDTSERTTLRFSVAHEDRELGADRRQFGVGLGIRF
jgi:YaiO family outer membrane protein